MTWNKSFVEVEGQKMAYVEMGQGRPIVFLHGNPTSSYLWRDVMPGLLGQGRCIAPDLIGMGDSAKLPNAGAGTYTFDTHSRYLAGFMRALGLDKDVVLVVHDWGSALGFDWANRNRAAVAAIAYMEGIVRPLSGWEEFSKQATPLFQALRSDAGEDLILNRNVFVEKILPGSVLHKLSASEMEMYRAPFQTPQDRWPTLTWPRQIPVAGVPADVTARVQAYADWMAENDLPKFFVNAEPGAILVGAAREFCRSWKAQTEATVAGSHFIQEDSGPAIGALLSDWLQGI